MSRAPSDPKGFYRILGLRPGADTAAIKAAYRTRAKELHPDHNPEPDAADSFARLSEAYHVLADPRRRAAYDAGASMRAAQRGARRPGGAGPGTGTGAGPREQAQREQHAGARAYAHAQARARAQAQSRAQSSGHGPAREAPPTGEARHAAAAANAAPLATCRRCGKFTAQPRHVVFSRVAGLITRSLIERIEGIFCRRCAQLTAVRASYFTWLRGWWSLRGPLDTIKALVVNLRGGELPAERNLALLVDQARAFLARRETDLARGAAEQAAAFIRTPADRREVEHLLGIIPRGQRRLRNRWSGVGWAAPVQLLPILVLGMAISLASARMPALVAGLGEGLGGPAPDAVEEAEALSAPEALSPREGRLNVVTVNRVTVRTGPGVAYRGAASLDKGTTLLVTELSPEGDWARILTAEGLVGFVEAETLRRRSPEDAP